MLNRVGMISLFALSGLCGFVLSWYMHASEPPVATATLPTYHSPALLVKQLVGDKQAGEKIFTAFCATCHAPKPVIETGAPRLGDERWRVLRKVGVKGLMPSVLHGVGAMPARGGCFECDDEQLKEAVTYMLKQQE